MCGIFGVWNAAKDEAMAYAVLGLHALQHRGQEGAGIVTNGQEDVATDFHHYSDAGLVSDIFSAENQQNFSLPGRAAIGHTRYATAGSGELKNLQPILQKTKRGDFALAHNGNLTNVESIRRDLLEQGALFLTDSDTEVILHLVSRSKAKANADALDEALSQVDGAYSLCIMTPEALIGARDPFGLRPLTLGKLDGVHMLASESCAIEAVGGEVVRDIDPGELVIITDDGVESRRLSCADKGEPRLCVFEYIYFTRPNTRFDARHSGSVRERIGAHLFLESHQATDIVVPVPESGVHAAVGYAQAANLPFKWAILKSPYVGRTFIEPTQSIRNFGVRLKLSVDQAAIAGKRVTLVDDSIVRSTTMRKLIELVRAAGAKEVHVRISSPPFRFPCFYGIDTPNREELIASSKSVDEIREIIGADSLAYISVEGLHKAVNGGTRSGFCDACFTGQYPALLSDSNMTRQLEGTDAVNGIQAV